MRYLVVALSLLMSSVTSAEAQASAGIDRPRVDIDVDVHAYPELALVPGYPVYYDPRGDSNYFFYDGAFWVYAGDNWYASSWYNGPWQKVEPEYVPLFLLRVPVRYYRRPPQYFGGWSTDEPPHWGERWGSGWERHRAGWDRWDRYSAPRPAPLPVYQKTYSGDRYPQAAEQQYSIRCEYYRYEPREKVARELLKEREYTGWYPTPTKWHAPDLKRPPHRVRHHRPERRGAAMSSARGGASSPPAR